MVVKGLVNIAKKSIGTGIVILSYNAGKYLIALPAGGIMDDMGVNEEVIQYITRLIPWLTAHASTYLKIMNDKEFSIARGIIQTITTVGIGYNLLSPVKTSELCDKITGSEIISGEHHLPVEHLGDVVNNVGAIADKIKSGSELEQMLEYGKDVRAPFVDVPYVFSDAGNVEDAAFTGKIIAGSMLMGVLQEYFKEGKNLRDKIENRYNKIKKNFSGMSDNPKKYWAQFGRDLALKAGALASCSMVAAAGYWLGDIGRANLMEYSSNGGVANWFMQLFAGPGGEAVRNLISAGGFYLGSKPWEWSMGKEKFEEKLGFLGPGRRYVLGITAGYNAIKLLEAVDIFGYKPFQPYKLFEFLGKEHEGCPILHWLGSREYGKTAWWNPLDPDWWGNIAKGLGKAIRFGVYKIPGIGPALENLKYQIPLVGKITNGLVNSDYPKESLQAMRLLLATTGYMIIRGAKEGKFDDLKEDYRLLRQDIDELKRKG
jgi:hypothetical protein